MTNINPAIKTLGFIFFLSTVVIWGHLYAESIDHSDNSDMAKVPAKEKIQELRKSLRFENDERKKLEIIASLSSLYEKQVGHYDISLRFCTTILNSTRSDIHDIRSTVETQKARLLFLKKRYQQQDQQITKISAAVIGSHEKNSQKQLAGINHLISTLPDYYKLHEAYYYQGLYYYQIKKYYSAVKAFDKALHLKPAIDFYLPVSAKRNSSVNLRNRDFIKNCSWIVSGLLLAINIIIFYRSRPWQWISLSHILIGVATLSLWFLFSKWIFWGIQPETLDLPASIQQKLLYEKPIFNKNLMVNMGHNPLSAFTIYSLLFIAGTYIFSMCVSNTGSTNTYFKSVFFSCSYSCLLFICLLSIFVWKSYYNDKCLFVSDTDTIAGILNGRYFYRSKDPEPYILINPKSYPNLNLKNISDDELIHWLTRYQDEHK